MDPSQLLGSSALSTGDPALDALLQSQFRSSGPAAGSGFSPGSMAGDIYGTAINSVPSGATAPTSGPAPTSASVGAGVAESPAARMLRLGGRLGAGSLGATVLAAPALQGPNAFGGDVNKQMASAKASDDADRNQFWKFWQHPLGYTNPLATQDAPPTTSSAPASAATDPPTLTRTQDQRYPPVPPTTNSYPPGPPGPTVRGPIPIEIPQMTVHPSQRAPNLGYGVPGAQPTPASDPINPLPGHYRASVGNARGATWVPGGMDNPAPQIFRGPTTMYGAPNYGKGPIGAQNYYQPGSAPMGPGDWTGTGPVAGPLAAFAGNNPQSTSSGGRGGGRFQMPASASAPARAPMIQPQGTHFGSTARKVFGNPAMWQYPNVQM